MSATPAVKRHGSSVHPGQRPGSRRHGGSGGNPARQRRRVYAPTVWHRDHRWAMVGIVGATAERPLETA